MKLRLAESMNAYLIKHGIKQKYVAEKSEIPENAFNLALHGKGRLLANEYERICKTLNVPFSQFVTRNTIQKPVKLQRSA